MGKIGRIAKENLAVRTHFLHENSRRQLVARHEPGINDRHAFNRRKPKAPVAGLARIGPVPAVALNILHAVIGPVMHTGQTLLTAFSHFIQVVFVRPKNPGVRVKPVAPVVIFKETQCQIAEEPVLGGDRLELAILKTDNSLSFGDEPISARFILFHHSMQSGFKAIGPGLGEVGPLPALQTPQLFPSGPQLFVLIYEENSLPGQPFERQQLAVPPQCHTLHTRDPDAAVRSRSKAGNIRASESFFSAQRIKSAMFKETDAARGTVMVFSPNPNTAIVILNHTFGELAGQSRTGAEVFATVARPMTDATFRGDPQTPVPARGDAPSIVAHQTLSMCQSLNFFRCNQE